MSFLSKTLGKVTDTLFGTQPKSGPGLPPPNLDFLRDPGYLKKILDPQDVPKFNSSQFNYLLNSKPIKYGSELSNLPNQAATFDQYYNAPTRTSGGAFQDYLSSINAPSSVDQVQRGVDSDLMAQLLSGVDTDTRNSIGSLKSDFADRGLSGPGMISDIEGNALAQAYSGADKTRAGIRSEFANKELERMKAQEMAQQAALGQRYGTEAGFDTQNMGIAAQGAMSDAQMFNELLGTSAGLKTDLLKTNQADQSTRDALFANLISQGSQAENASKNEYQMLLAQLLNQRDLARATGQVQTYGSSGTSGGGKNPILGPIGIDFAFGGK